MKQISRGSNSQVLFANSETANCETVNCETVSETVRQLISSDSQVLFAKGETGDKLAKMS